MNAQGRQSDTVVEWRVSWQMWVPGDPEPRRVERVTSDESSAREQLEGLLSMLAPHPLRPCGDHVWDPQLECREVRQDEWGLVR